MATKNKKKLTRDEVEAANKKRQQKMTIIIGFLIFIMLLGASCFAYILLSENNRQVATEEAIQDITYSRFQRAAKSLEKADLEGETYASEFLAWLYASAGRYNEAYKYAVRAVNFDRKSSYEVLGDLALLRVSDIQGPQAAISFFEKGALKLANDQGMRIRNGERQTRPDATLSWYQGPDDALTTGQISDRATALFSDMVRRGLNLVGSEKDYTDLVLSSLKKGAFGFDLEVGDLMFIGNEGLSPNAEVAVRYWKDAMDKGNTDAFVRLAGVNWHGYGQKTRDPQTAIDLYSAAAEQNNPIALYALGLITLRSANSNLRTNRSAVELFSRASALGYGPASTALGVLSLTETTNELAAVKAAQWLRIAAEEQKDVSGRVLYDLMLMSGTGVPMDFNTGFNDMILLGDSFPPAASILGLLQARENPVEILHQAMLLSNRVLRGEIAYREGDPIAQKEIPDPVTGKPLLRPFTFYTSVKEMDVAEKSRFGENNYREISDFSFVTIEGKPLMHIDLAKIIIQYAPSTGAKKFEPNMKMPRPYPPRVPHHYNISDFVPPVGLVEDQPYLNPDTQAVNTLF